MTLVSPLLIVLFYGIIFYFSFNKDISDTAKKVLVVDESGHFENQCDQLVHINVWTPKKLSSDEKAILEKLRGSENFEPKPEHNERNFFDRMREFFN